MTFLKISLSESWAGIKLKLANTMIKLSRYLFSLLNTCLGKLFVFFILTSKCIKILNKKKLSPIKTAFQNLEKLKDYSLTTFSVVTLEFTSFIFTMYTPFGRFANEMLD